MWEDSFAEVWAGLTARSSRRRITKSAMTPYLYFCWFALPCFGTAYLFREDEFASRTLIIVGILPIFLTVLMGFIFGIWDRERLQSEEHGRGMRVIGLVESKGGKIKFNPLDLANLANPYPEPKSIGYRNPEPEPPAEDRKDGGEGRNDG